MAQRGRPPAPSRRPSKSPVFNRPVRDYEPAPLEVKALPPNFDLLDEEMRAKLRAEAAEEVRAREEKRAMRAFLKAETDCLERELHPEAHEPTEEIVVDLAIYCDRIRIDNRDYMHGQKYTVPKSRADAMRDIMAHTYKHYRETHKDPTEEMYQAQRAVTKGGSSFATISASGVTRF